MIRWQELLGEPFDGEIRFGPPGGPEFGAGGRTVREFLSEWSTRSSDLGCHMGRTKWFFVCMECRSGRGLAIEHGPARGRKSPCGSGARLGSVWARRPFRGFGGFRDWDGRQGGFSRPTPPDDEDKGGDKKPGEPDQQRPAVLCAPSTAAPAALDRPRLPSSRSGPGSGTIAPRPPDRGPGGGPGPRPPDKDRDDRAGASTARPRAGFPGTAGRCTIGSGRPGGAGPVPGATGALRIIAQRGGFAGRGGWGGSSSHGWRGGFGHWQGFAGACRGSWGRRLGLPRQPRSAGRPSWSSRRLRPWAWTLRPLWPARAWAITTARRLAGTGAASTVSWAVSASTATIGDRALAITAAMASVATAGRRVVSGIMTRTGVAQASATAEGRDRTSGTRASTAGPGGRESSRSGSHDWRGGPGQRPGNRPQPPQASRPANPPRGGGGGGGAAAPRLHKLTGGGLKFKRGRCSTHRQPPNFRAK